MNVWELIILQPVVNVLIVMTSFLGNNFGVAIIALTIVVNLAMMPLTLKQTRASKSMQEMQPKLLELRKKYEKDRQKLAQEQMRLYKESGMNPVGCLGPMLIQMPIWIALYQSIILSLAVAPEALLNLARFLYPWPVVYSALPLSNDFLGLDLATPNLVLAVLVGATMWLQQKMATPAMVDPNQQAQSRMMLWMMPLMFAFLALSFPSGLSLFWVTSSVVRIAVQYKVTGWGGLAPAEGAGAQPPRKQKQLRIVTRSEEQAIKDVGADIVETDEERRERDRGLGYPAKPSKSRYQPGKDRSRYFRKK